MQIRDIHIFITIHRKSHVQYVSPSMFEMTLYYYLNCLRLCLLRSQSKIMRQNIYCVYLYSQFIFLNILWIYNSPFHLCKEQHLSNVSKTSELPSCCILMSTWGDIFVPFYNASLGNVLPSNTHALLFFYFSSHNVSPLLRSYYI